MSVTEILATPVGGARGLTDLWRAASGFGVTSKK
jgi:hypothetical protein